MRLRTPATCLALLLPPVLFSSAPPSSPPSGSYLGDDENLGPIIGRPIWDLSRIHDRTQSRFELTDLIRFRDRFYCGFREGEIHGNHPSGRARIIRSADGRNWESVALLEWEGGDVRAPRLAITAEGHLIAYTSVYFVSQEPRAGGKYYQLGEAGSTDTDNEAEVSRQSVTWLSADGENWSGAQSEPTGANTFRWSLTWHNGMGYSVAYSGKDVDGALYRTRDGRSWRLLRDRFFPEGRGNEAGLVFDADDTAFCLVRDAPGSRMLGVGKAPYYQDWEWKNTRVDWEGNGRRQAVDEVIPSLGAPKLLRLRDGRLLAVGRAGGISLFWLDPENAALIRFARIGGSSYAGIAEHAGSVWVSYGHSSAAAIYLAEVRLPAPRGKRR